MDNISDLDRLQASLTTAKTLLIVLPQQLTLDKVAASLALFLSLKKAGKQSSIACAKPMTVEYSTLVGVDQITDKLGGNNLVVSFDYAEDSIEKVSYNIENKLFNLVIQPKAGFAPLSPDKVKYSSSGGQADLFLVLGANYPDDLGQLFTDNRDTFVTDKVALLDINSQNLASVGYRFVEPNAAAYCELIAGMLFRLQLPTDEDIATNLLTGLEDATNKYTSAKVSADTFEAAAYCLRAGAKRTSNSPTNQQSNQLPNSLPNTPPPQPAAAPTPDWFEPKIYKGNTQV